MGQVPNADNIAELLEAALELDKVVTAIVGTASDFLQDMETITGFDNSATFENIAIGIDSYIEGLNSIAMALSGADNKTLQSVLELTTGTIDEKGQLTPESLRIGTVQALTQTFGVIIGLADQLQKFAELKITENTVMQFEETMENFSELLDITFDELIKVYTELLEDDKVKELSSLMMGNPMTLQTVEELDKGQGLKTEDILENQEENAKLAEKQPLGLLDLIMGFFSLAEIMNNLEVPNLIKFKVTMILFRIGVQMIFEEIAKLKDIIEDPEIFDKMAQVSGKFTSVQDLANAMDETVETLLAFSINTIVGYKVMQVGLYLFAHKSKDGEMKGILGQLLTTFDKDTIDKMQADMKPAIATIDQLSGIVESLAKLSDSLLMLGPKCIIAAINIVFVKLLLKRIDPVVEMLTGDSKSSLALADPKKAKNAFETLDATANAITAINKMCMITIVGAVLYLPAAIALILLRYTVLPLIKGIVNSLASPKFAKNINKGIKNLDKLSMAIIKMSVAIMLMVLTGLVVMLGLKQLMITTLAMVLIIGVFIILALASKTIKKGCQSLMLLSIAIALLSLDVMLMVLVGMVVEENLKTLLIGLFTALLVIGVFVLALVGFALLDKFLKKGLIIMTMLAITIAVMSIALILIALVSMVYASVDWMSLIKIFVLIGGFALLAFICGSAASMIGIGVAVLLGLALSLVGVAFALLIFVGALKLLESLDVELAMSNLGGILKGLINIFLDIGPAGLVGAALGLAISYALAPVAVALIILIGSCWLVEKIVKNITIEEFIQNTGDLLKGLLSIFAEIGIAGVAQAVVALLVCTMLTPVAVELLVIAAAMWAVDKMISNIDLSTLKSQIDGTIDLMLGVCDKMSLGYLVTIPKAIGVLALFVAVAAELLVIGLAIGGVAALNINTKQANKNTQGSLGVIFNAIEILDDNDCGGFWIVGKFFKLMMISKMISIMTANIAEIASLKYAIKWDEKGNPTDYKQMKPKDFALAAENASGVCMFMQAIVGSDPSVIKFGGKSILVPGLGDLNVSWSQLIDFMQLMVISKAISEMTANIAEIAALNYAVEWNNEGKPIKYKQMKPNDFQRAIENASAVGAFMQAIIRCDDSEITVAGSKILVPGLGDLNVSWRNMYEFLKLNIIAHAVAGMALTIGSIAGMNYASKWNEKGDPIEFKQMKQKDFELAIQNASAVGAFMQAIIREDNSEIEVNGSKILVHGLGGADVWWGDLYSFFNLYGIAIAVAGMARTIGSIASMNYATKWDEKGMPIEFKQMKNDDFVNAVKNAAFVAGFMQMIISPDGGDLEYSGGKVHVFGLGNTNVWWSDYWNFVKLNWIAQHLSYMTRSIACISNMRYATAWNDKGIATNYERMKSEDFVNAVKNANFVAGFMQLIISSGGGDLEYAGGKIRVTGVGGTGVWWSDYWNFVKLNWIAQHLSYMTRSIAMIATMKYATAWNDKGVATKYARMKAEDFKLAAENAMATSQFMIAIVGSGTTNLSFGGKQTPITGIGTIYIGEEKLEQFTLLNQIAMKLSLMTASISAISSLKYATAWNDKGEPTKYKKLTSDDFMTAAQNAASIANFLLALVSPGKQLLWANGKPIVVNGIGGKVINPLGLEAIEQITTVAKQISSMTESVANMATLKYAIAWDGEGKPTKYKQLKGDQLQLAVKNALDILLLYANAMMGPEMTQFANNDFGEIESNMEMLITVSNDIGILASQVGSLGAGRIYVLDPTDPTKIKAKINFANVNLEETKARMLMMISIYTEIVEMIKPLRTTIESGVEILETFVEMTGPISELAVKTKDLVKLLQPLVLPDNKYIILDMLFIYGVAMNYIGRKFRQSNIERGATQIIWFLVYAPDIYKLSAWTDRIIQKLESHDLRRHIRMLYYLTDNYGYALASLGYNYSVKYIRESMQMIKMFVQTSPALYRLSNNLVKITKSSAGIMFRNIDNLEVGLRRIVNAVNGNSFWGFDDRKITRYKNMLDIADKFTSISNNSNTSKIEGNVTNFIKFIDKANSIDIERIKSVADMMRQVAEFSKSIEGNFDALAETLNEDLMTVLVELKEVLESTNTAIEEMNENGSISVEGGEGGETTTETTPSGDKKPAKSNDKPKEEKSNNKDDFSQMEGYLRTISQNLRSIKSKISGN